jgi:hypothetical protein
MAIIVVEPRDEAHVSTSIRILCRVGINARRSKRPFANGWLYVKPEQTKCIAVQFGYSDSGRFIGQMAATFRIERLRLRIAQLLERHALESLEIILFNTHGVCN